jgi:POT family proton-dependent oligopeptide transporter
MENTLLKQPKSAFLLIFTQSWESFSYFGMRVLLVLYLISQLGFSDSQAYATYALYITLIELGAFVGGYIGDRYLGHRPAVLLGGCFILFGHLCMAVSDDLFLGISAIAFGAALFRANLKALLGMQYGENDPRRESGFTLLHTGMNAGGFSAALLCGYVANTYGGHVGFGLAAFGMLIAMGVYCGRSHLFKTSENKQSSVLQFFACALCGVAVTIALRYLFIHGTQMLGTVHTIAVTAFFVLLILLCRKLTAQISRTLIGILALLICFFTFEQLNGSFMMVFCERYVDKTIAGIYIPSATLAAANPFAIILIGPFLSRELLRFRISMLTRIGISFLLLGVSFAVLYASGSSVIAVALSFAFVGMAELFIAPTIYAFCTEHAPDNAKGMMMGLVTMAMAVANLCSGKLGLYAAQVPEEALPTLFGISALICLLLFIAMIIKDAFMPLVVSRKENVLL